MGKIYYIIVAFAALLFTACQEEDFGSETKGGIRISLAEEVGMDISTRSTPKELGKPLASNFKFRITDSEGHKEDHNYTDDVIPLSAGKYEVVAYCGSSATTIALDAPYYEGTAEATVEEGKTTNITLACKVANALLSIRINEDDKEKFNAAFPESYFKLSLESGDNKVSSDTTKSFYFPAGSTITKLAFSKDDSDYQDLGIKNWPPSIKAADHIIVTVGIEPAPSGVSLAVEKIDVQEVPISETIPLEWLPAPKIGYFNNQENVTSIEYTETAAAIPAVLNFSGSMDIQDVEFSFEFGDKQEQFQALNSKTFTFSTLTEEDKTLLETANVELPSFSGNTGTWSLNDMTAHLQVAEGSSTENKIKLRVKANDRWSSEESKPSVYTIKTVVPKITVTAKPEDIWAKSLTVNSYQVESENPNKITVTGYQYLDGAEWKDCTDGLAKLTNLPEEPKMQVRAVYREGVYAEPTEIALETPAQLPNSDMEEWSYETYKGDRYSFNPWNSEGTSFWDTNNDFTTRHKNGASDVSIANYNGFHAVSCVTGHNGFAAELRSTANGRANTRVDFIVHTHKEQDYNKVAGKLFTGSANVYVNKPSGTIGDDADGSKDTYTEEKNASFNSRPTALTFYYKYVPYNSDTWSVHIELLDENKNVIIQNDKTSSEAKSDWTQASVSLDYADGTTYAKCKYIYVIFKSTINEGTNMPYREITQTFYVLENGALSAKTYDQAYIGSVLTIDDIQLIYDK